MLNEDYKDMLQCLLKEKVRFLLVRAYAVAVYGYPRATKDIDIFVRAAPDNATSLMRALSRFGVPLSEVSEADFSKEGICLAELLAPLSEAERRDHSRQVPVFGRLR